MTGSAAFRRLVTEARASADDDLAHVGPVLRAARELPDGVRLLHLRAAQPSIAFSRRDTHREGFDAAASVAAELGYPPLVRHVGGAFAPLSEGSLVLDQFGTSPDAGTTSRARFGEHSTALRAALRGLGLDARVGELAGEYCPGEFSINVAGRVKVAGVAQRVSGRAWVVSTVLQVHAVHPLRAVTQRCAGALGEHVDVATMGDLASEGVDVPLPDVARLVADAFVRAGLVGAGDVLDESAVVAPE
ncbi:MAG: lipoate--protein ligase family protein [Actinomycetota bacterium]|nr:lipoate--protein ligase family protein [Actinomycetota bacterium]